MRCADQRRVLSDKLGRVNDLKAEPENMLASVTLVQR